MLEASIGATSCPCSLASQDRKPYFHDNNLRDHNAVLFIIFALFDTEAALSTTYLSLHTPH